MMHISQLMQELLEELEAVPTGEASVVLEDE
jgi:hypothetical protein